MAKIAIIQFPGSNTERETFMACERTGLTPVEFLWNEPVQELSKFHGYILVGGFYFFLIKGIIWLLIVLGAALGIGKIF